MINFLPVIFQDELLFSVISRYKQMCGMESKRALEMDLFRIYKRMGRKSVLFPQNICVFASNLPPTSKISIKEIIVNHTMYPFYTAFLCEKSEMVYKGMEEGNGKNIENMVGMSGSKVKSSNYLRYCPLCFKHDIEQLGESYWRRLPQVPGTIYCPIHQVHYKDSNVVITDSRNDFLCADEDTCDTDLATDEYSNEFKELNLKYVENASYLLLHMQKRKGQTFIINFYIDRLRERGLASKNGTLYLDKLFDAFLNFYPPDYLKIMQSRVELDQNANWLKLFVRNNNKNRSTLRHLLFLQFLGVNASELFETDNAIGKQVVTPKRIPKYNIEEQRKKWITIIEDNPGANRSELKSIGKGLHTWIYMNDRVWYEQVTPRIIRRKEKTNAVDWEKRDEECLVFAKEAVEKLLQTKGKPVRINPSTIRRTIGAKRWFNHQKLVKTRQFINAISEDIESYRIRKIKWAINDMIERGENLTVYKIQLKAGFGGGDNEIKGLIQRILGE